MERGIMVAHLLVEAGQHVPVRVFNPSNQPVRELHMHLLVKTEAPEGSGVNLHTCKIMS